ncbi:MAG: hypothetical protein DRR42_12225 [Gammaproteobacteria bacterium]|nr:MAG: hypothetical protein DRR42_12225 [Gammaproteobacteria bacterium]
MNYYHYPGPNEIRYEARNRIRMGAPGPIVGPGDYLMRAFAQCPGALAIGLEAGYVDSLMVSGHW